MTQTFWLTFSLDTAYILHAISFYSRHIKSLPLKMGNVYKLN